MWSRKDKDDDTILVATRVDDSIVTGSNDDKTDTFVRELLDDLRVHANVTSPRDARYGMGTRHVLVLLTNLLRLILCCTADIELSWVHWVG